MSEELKSIAKLARDFIAGCEEPDDGADYYSAWKEGDLARYYYLVEALNSYFGTSWEVAEFNDMALMHSIACVEKEKS